MGNLFDSANYAHTEPGEIVSGDRLAWKRTDLGSDYPPASYTLTYSARRESDGTDSVAITAIADGNDFVVEVGQATTAAYEVGDYLWQAHITRDLDSERLTIDSGSWEVVANRATATTDPRTHAKIVLDAIEAVIEGRATKDQESYTIADRSLSRTPMSDLIMLRSRYRAEVWQEISAERVANGGRDGTLIRPRFQA